MQRTDPRETRPHDRRTELGFCLDEMRAILFEGTGPAESRIEALLDRIERRP